MLVAQPIPLTHQRLPADLRRPDISATTSETLATCSVAPWSAVGKLNQNNAAERLRKGLRLLLKLKIDA
jgi:hypothetical protein